MPITTIYELEAIDAKGLAVSVQHGSLGEAEKAYNELHTRAERGDTGVRVVKLYQRDRADGLEPGDRITLLRERDFTVPLPPPQGAASEQGWWPSSWCALL
jgi:hypothetical protein